ncbi:MAG: hypothetical protein J7K04_07680 [Spirochaetales bacterium]|nr:hypothetical protein [Spirochaetales bacterium]
MDILKRASNSFLIEAFLTLIIYVFYAVILGLSFTPSLYLLSRALKTYILPDLSTGTLVIPNVLIFGFASGIAVFLFFITGLVIMSAFVRMLSLGVKEGKYPAVSLTTLRWLIYSGIYNLAVRMILPVIPMTFFSTLFFRIIGCKIGKNVYLNTWILNDAYLMEIGDNVIIGGGTDLSCHIYEHGYLKLKPIKIGRDTLIGAHCYISPGVTIGKNCLIGLNSYIRQDRNIRDNTKITSLAGISLHKAHKIEKERFII